MASHEAARRAVKAGYKNVSVMADGIMGWKSAGQPTAKVSASKVGNS
jgi:rhodanese-related sulfurtransferase